MPDSRPAPSGRRWPITVKLPLLIGGLLVVVTAIYSSAAYTAMVRSALAIATAHLDTATVQFARSLHQSRDQLVGAMRGAADSAALREFLARPDGRHRTRALAVLQSTGGPPAQLAVSELLDAAGRQVLAIGGSERWNDSAVRAELIRGAAGADSGYVGAFRAVGDSILIPVAGRVMAGGSLRGYLVQWHRLMTTPEARRRTGQIVGTGATIYLGNAAGDVWTDLSLRAPAPPVDVSQDTGVLRYRRAGGLDVLATARTVHGTPWIVLLEFPSADVVAPARLFLGRLGAIGAIVLLLGLVAAYAVSRTLTRPLAQLTQAAEEIAAGSFTGTAGVAERGDELGRLASAFETMAQHVRASQQELEARVRARTAELQERNEELEAFAYSISHDLRAPLRAMGGFSQAMLEDYGDRLDETGRGYAQRVVTAAQTMDQLIRDLLTYSKVTRSELELAPLNLSRILKGVVRGLEGEIRERRARVTLDELPPDVMGHESTLTQVMTNLLANAIKFVPPERPPEVRVRWERRGGRLRLWVEDNGIGIAPEHHERVFRVFERLHAAEEYPGTGIGLAIVRKGAERMGGRAGLESTLGQGSRFWIELSLAEERNERERHSDTAG
ncbi:MAG TPA: ATP-binding protein [Gemmatimonadales bacterium]